MCSSSDHPRTYKPPKPPQGCLFPTSPVSYESQIPVVHLLKRADCSWMPKYLAKYCMQGHTIPRAEREGKTLTGRPGGRSGREVSHIFLDGEPPQANDLSSSHCTCLATTRKRARRLNCVTTCRLPHAKLLSGERSSMKSLRYLRACSSASSRVRRLFLGRPRSLSSVRCSETCFWTL